MGLETSSFWTPKEGFFIDWRTKDDAGKVLLLEGRNQIFLISTIWSPRSWFLGDVHTFFFPHIHYQIIFSLENSEAKLLHETSLEQSLRSCIGKATVICTLGKIISSMDVWCWRCRNAAFLSVLSEEENESIGGRKRGKQKTRKASINLQNSHLTAGNSLFTGTMKTLKILVSHLSALFSMLWNYVWSCSYGSRWPACSKRKRWWILLDTDPCSKQIKGVCTEWRTDLDLSHSHFLNIQCWQDFIFSVLSMSNSFSVSWKKRIVNRQQHCGSDRASD